MVLHDSLDLSWIGALNTDALITALAVFMIVAVGLWLTKRYVISTLKKLSARTRTKVDDIILDGLSALSAPFYIIAGIWAAGKTLVLSGWVQTGLDILLLLAGTYYGVQIVRELVRSVAGRYDQQTGDRIDDSFPDLLARIVTAALWVLAFLFILTNLGLEIGPLLAGVGVAGIAVAFALQNVLEDLFSSFSIYFDKPFETGDFIIIGEDMGVVEYIGLKTTRIRTLQGQQLVVANRELTSTRINNYKRMEKRRIQFGFGVEYATPVEKLEQVNDVVRDAIQTRQKCELDRSHFKAFEDSSLAFEVVYYLESSDYNEYMDVQQSINLAIKRGLEDLGVSMAFPTRTVHLHGSER